MFDNFKRRVLTALDRSLDRNVPDAEPKIERRRRDVVVTAARFHTTSGEQEQLPGERRWTPPNFAPCRPRSRNATSPILRPRVITLKAKGSIDNEGIACKVETGRALAVAGLHPATGGSGLELCSGDMLLEALVACAGVTLKSVATARRRSAQERPRHRRGRSRFPRHARRRQGSPGRLCRKSACASTSSTDAPQDKLDLLLKLTERYCVVYQTIRNGPKVAVSMKRV